MEAAQPTLSVSDVTNIVKSGLAEALSQFQEGIDRAIKDQKKDSEKTLEAVEEIQRNLDKRNKLIRLADKSEAGRTIMFIYQILYRLY